MSDESEKYETTAEHFEIFKAAAQEFIDLFGLWDWYVDFSHQEMDEEWMASCEFSTGSGKAATLSLAKNYGTKATEDVLRESAFHEVCHLLLADAHNAGIADDLSQGQRYLHVDRAHHAVIRRLENVILPRL